MKVYKKKQNRSTNNQDCEYAVLWYTINALMRRKSCFMQMILSSRLVNAFLVNIYTNKYEYWTRSSMLSDPDRVLCIYI